MPAEGRRLLATGAGRRLAFALLYFAEGAPIGFIWWALPVWLRTAGTPVEEIARIMAWVAWPWAVKFLWAPLIDVARGPRFGLRGWIVVSQLGMALTLAPLLFVDLGAHGDLLLLLLGAHAVTAATQDASIDSLAIHRIPSGERGAINGWMQVGMLGARGLFGGGAVLLAARVGQQGTIVLLIATVLLTSLTVILGLGPDTRADGGARRTPYLAALGGMLRRRELWAGLLFATVAGAGFESLASMGGPLLLDRGASEETVGSFFLVPAVLCMAVGALVGGRASDRFGRRRTTLVGEALAALAVIAVGGAAAWSAADTGPGLFVGLLALLYLAAGAATAALYGLLMSLVEPSVAATQFCAFMACINLCYVWSTRTLGLLVERFGYGPALLTLGAASLASLPLLRWMEPGRTGVTASNAAVG